MIKATNNGHIKTKGTEAELLADLINIVHSLMTKGEISEEIIDVAIGLAKAKVKGNAKEYMSKMLKQRFKKVTEMAIDVKGLLKQIKEDNEKEEEQ